MKRKAVLIGSSGRIGQALARELSALYDTLIIIARTPPQRISENMHIYHVPDFHTLASTIDSMPLGADTDAFSCLEVAKKDTNSDEEFYQINVLFNVIFAQACQAKGVKRFFYLSKAGADNPQKDPELLAKAEVEQSLQSLDFDVVSFRLDKLTPAKDKLSLKSVGRFGMQLAKTTLDKITPFHKTEALTPKRIAIAISLSAYRLNLNHKHRQAAGHFHAISHDDMCKMSEMEGR